MGGRGSCACVGGGPLPTRLPGCSPLLHHPPVPAADTSKFGTSVSPRGTFAEGDVQALASGGPAARVPHGHTVQWGHRSPFRLYYQVSAAGGGGWGDLVAVGLGVQLAASLHLLRGTRLMTHACARPPPPAQDWVLHVPASQRAGTDAATLAALEEAAAATGLPLAGAQEAPAFTRAAALARAETAPVCPLSHSPLGVDRRRRCPLQTSCQTTPARGCWRWAPRRCAWMAPCCWRCCAATPSSAPTGELDSQGCLHHR